MNKQSIGGAISDNHRIKAALAACEGIDTCALELMTGPLLIIRQIESRAMSKPEPKKSKANQYKRMFEAACVALGEVGDALGCDPDEGGAEPLLDAIAELKKAAAVKSFGEQHPHNPAAKCKCEHWQSCADCHPTAHAAPDVQHIPADDTEGGEL